MALFPFAVLVLLLLAVLFLFWALRRWTSPRGGGSRGPEARVPGVQRPYGVSESIGRRPTMEDRHRVLPLKRGLPHFRGPSGLPPTLYGVFDGHAGSAAADYCSARLGEVLMRDAAWPSAPAAALTSAFHVLDASFLELARLTSPPLNDGTTAVVALALGARSAGVVARGKQPGVPGLQSCRSTQSAAAGRGPRASSGSSSRESETALGRMAALQARRGGEISPRTCGRCGVAELLNDATPRRAV